MRSAFQFEIDFAGHPVLVALGQQGRDEEETGRGVGEDRGDASAALDLAIDAFEAVGGTQPNPFPIYREAVGQVFLGPLVEFGGIGGPELDGLLHKAFSLGAIRRIEVRPNALCHGLPTLNLR